MVDITLGPRRSNGRFGFVKTADGDVQFDDTQAHAVVTSAVEQQGSWVFDPTHGSKLYTLRSLTAKTPSQAEAMVLEAEAPLEQDNAVVGVTASAKAELNQGQRTGRLDVQIKWTTPGGLSQSERVGV
jgi:phage gp46-like protein